MVADDKANAEDLALAAERLNPKQVASIPRCLYRYIRPDGNEVPLGVKPEPEDLSIPDIDALAALTWVRARRDDPEIDYAAVRKSIPVTDSAKIREISKELFYFFTDISRDEADLLFRSAEEENPPPEPEMADSAEALLDLVSQTSSEA